jgi:signal peptidase I
MSSVDDHFPTQAVPMTSLPEGDDRVKITRRRVEPRGLAWELLQTIVLTLVIFVAVRSVVQNFRVEGDSMKPTLLSGQYLLINRAAYFHLEGTPIDTLIPSSAQGSVRYLFGGPQRGDIAVFRAPTQPDKDFIKRIIALPGDTVLIRNGEVYVNGQLLDEPYIRFPASYNYPITGNPITVRDGQYFVLGDNRPNSSDSHQGWFVPVDHLVGRAWLSYWPPNAWGVTPHAAYAQ